MNRISKSLEISLSTLKLNARILKNLGLIDFGNCSVAHLTDFGKYIMKIMKVSRNKKSKRVRSLTWFRTSALGAENGSSNLSGPTKLITGKRI